ncbi:hypothetical protein [Bacteroides sp.]|uniref:hypothetical protein n=1 Tax=Bacteroides sp. TaxID=29523 RepID=UPI00262E4F42|nr:hypothetical protein [Bacteroides sp.]MDD3038129.1 hypothetical protein [Bacteroides sp.]
MVKMMTETTRLNLHAKSIENIEAIRCKINEIIKLYNTGKYPIKLLQFDMFVSMTMSDSFVLVKQYTAADQRWEEIFIAEQIYIKMNESLKKLIGFHKDGDRKSYWIKIMGSYVQNHKELLEEYDTIKKKLIQYAQNEELQCYIKSYRNYAIHGDEDLDSLKLFKEINEINIDYTFKLFTQWAEFLKSISAFISSCYKNEVEKLK